jgi:hypothetical protein
MTKQKSAGAQAPPGSLGRPLLAAVVASVAIVFLLVALMGTEWVVRRRYDLP